MNSDHGQTQQDLHTGRATTARPASPTAKDAPNMTRASRPMATSTRPIRLSASPASPQPPCPSSTPCWSASRTTCSISAPISPPRPPTSRSATSPCASSMAQVTRLEQEIDVLNARLTPLRSFVLPGGSSAAAALHLARAISRRAERRMVALAAVRRGGQRASAAIHQPSFRFPFRRRARRQSRRRRRRSLEAGPEPLTRLPPRETPRGSGSTARGDGVDLLQSRDYQMIPSFPVVRNRGLRRLSKFAGRMRYTSKVCDDLALVRRRRSC